MWWAARSMVLPARGLGQLGVFVRCWRAKVSGGTILSLLSAGNRWDGLARIEVVKENSAPG
jgi:hypothetical protein